MKTFLKAVFGFGFLIGLFVMMCAFSTIDYPGSIPISDGQIFSLAIIGVSIVAVSVLGWKSLEQKGD